MHATRGDTVKTLAVGAHGKGLELAWREDRDLAGAVATFQLREFDVVLTDVQMPEMDGLEAAAAIRQLESAGVLRTPIVVLTAHAMKGDRERFLAAGLDDYVAKPVRPPALMEAIRRAVRASRHAGSP